MGDIRPDAVGGISVVSRVAMAHASVLGLRGESCLFLASGWMPQHHHLDPVASKSGAENPDTEVGVRMMTCTRVICGQKSDLCHFRRSSGRSARTAGREGAVGSREFDLAVE